MLTLLPEWRPIPENVAVWRSVCCENTGDVCIEAEWGFARRTGLACIFAVRSMSHRETQLPPVVVFEDDHFLVVHKPAGWNTHAPAPHAGEGIYEWLKHREPRWARLSILHRLDKETSGLIVLAKNERAHRWLQDQFRLRTVEKTYLALVDGKPPTPTGRVEASIGRDPSHRKKMAIVPAGKGRESVSEYMTLESFKEHTLLEFHPHTGRTHQIRLHCQFLGCPIVGDSIYGKKSLTVDIKRHFLHAAKLKIVLPNETSPRVFEAELPAELMLVMEEVRRSE